MEYQNHIRMPIRQEYNLQPDCCDLSFLLGLNYLWISHVIHNSHQKWRMLGGDRCLCWDYVIRYILNITKNKEKSLGHYFDTQFPPPGSSAMCKDALKNSCLAVAAAACIWSQTQAVGRSSSFLSLDLSLGWQGSVSSFVGSSAERVRSNGWVSTHTPTPLL